MLKLIKKILYILFCAGSFFCSLLAQESIKSNELILKELTIKALEKYIQNIELNQHDTISIRYIYDYNKQFLYDLIIDYLKNQKKLNIRIAESFGDNYFEYYIDKLEISYTKPYRAKFLEEKIISRYINIGYSFKFIEQDNIVSYEPIELSFSDTIYHHHIEEIENKMLPLTVAKMPENSLIDKYTIPIITISTLSIIVYLFFTIRK